MACLELLCLANSFKHKQRCIAGLRMDGGGWVRPVSATVRGELLESQYRLHDGTEPRLLDILRVGLAGAKPLAYQPENWLIDGSPWRLLRRPAGGNAANILRDAVERCEKLFGDDAPSITEQETLRRGTKSLCLVEPSEVTWRTLFDDYEMRIRGRVRFRLGACEYDLPVTDPVMLGRMQSRKVGEHRGPDIGLPSDARYAFTISLGEPWRGVCYKLMAAVVVLPPGWLR